MALYVKDPEVDALVARLALVKRKTKTEVVRLALQHELERENASPTLVEIGVDFCRALRARADGLGGKSADKAFIDSLYDGP